MSLTGSLVGSTQMGAEDASRLAHVRWIGGGSGAGKSTGSSPMLRDEHFTAEIADDEV
ncbi:MAG: hypothetical protein M3406_04855 [Chloroflexota bacterium]|nr:hypothetical protein [Chloroflexota bacterium]